MRNFVPTNPGATANGAPKMSGGNCQVGARKAAIYAKSILNGRFAVE